MSKETKVIKEHRKSRAAYVVQLINGKEEYYVSKLKRKLDRKGYSTNNLKQVTKKAADALGVHVVWEKGTHGADKLVITPAE